MGNPETLDIQSLCEEASNTAREKGFSNQPFTEFLALVHSELSEALEEFRNHKGLNEVWYSKSYESDGIKYTSACDKGDGGKPEGIPVELADVVIRICHYCGEHGIDLPLALREKLAFNRTRAYKHGNKKI